MADIRFLELRNTYKWGGGPDKTILLSAEQHDRSRISVVLAYIRDVHDCDFQISEKARGKGLTFYEIEERGKFDPRVIRALRDIVDHHDINLIHSHDYKSDLFAYLVARRFCRRPIRLLSTAHAWVMLGLRGELYRRIDLFLMRFFDHLIAVSHATKAEMVAGGLPDDHITVIHNAIDTLDWSPAHTTTTIREELGLQKAFPVIGYIGRIAPEKDLETWLRAAAIIAAKYHAARFVLVGDGRGNDTQSRLERLARKLDIAQQVIFLGYRSRLQPVYAAFDLFLLSSRREGLPNCILEAMAMGLPVVTTDVAGVKELVVDGETGFVLPQGDFQGLGHAMLRLVRDDQDLQRMGKAGRVRIEREFSFTNRLRRIENLYARLAP